MFITKNDMLKLSRGNVELTNYLCLNEDQLRKVLAWRNNSEVNKWLIDRTIISWQQHLMFVEHLKASVETNYWMVTYKGEESGVVSLILDMEDSSASAGIFLAPEYLESGYGVEIGFETRHIYFEQLGISTLYGTVYTGNQNALKMHRIAGYQISPHPDLEGAVMIKMTNQQYQKLPKDYQSYLKLIRTNRNKHWPTAE